MQTITLLKNDFKKEESRNIDREIALEKKIKQLDNIVCKRYQSAQTLEPKLYDGNVIKNTSAIMIPDSEETLMLAEESHSKMLLKQQDLMVLEKKFNTTPVDYVNSINSSDPSPSYRPTKVEVPKELPKVSMAVEQHRLESKTFEVKMNQVLNENERLLEQVINNDIVNIIINSSVDNTYVNVHECEKCLKLKTELLNKMDFIEIETYNKLFKSFTTLEKHCISLEVDTQLKLEIFQRDNSVSNQSAPSFDQHFELNELKAQSQEKDTVIKKLKERIKSLSGNMSKDKIKKDIEEIEMINIELDHMVLHEKVLVITTLKNELRKLKGKDLADNVVTKNTIALEMLKIDVEPIAPKLLNNRTAHSYYLRHTQEQAAIIKKISKRKVWKPTRKVFTNIGYTWRPTGQTFTIVGNVCPLTRITTTAEVPLRKLTALESDTHKPVATLVYSRKPRKSKTIIPDSKPKIIKSVSANNKEPSKSLGSIVSEVPSSSLDECRSSKLFSGIVKFRNDHQAKILGYGDYQIGNVTISRVYYVEGLGHNLFSIGKFCDSNLEVAFRQNTCFIRNLKGVDLLTGSRGNNLIDNGTEFVNQTLREYYEKVGISHETSIARSPHQNGVVERRNRTLIEATHTMLIYEKAPLFLWAEAVATALVAPEHALASTGAHSSTTVDQGCMVRVVDMSSYQARDRRPRRRDGRVSKENLPQIVQEIQEKLKDQPSDPYLTPHSCGEPCGKALEKDLAANASYDDDEGDHCSHRCVVQCHPGPCPPYKAFAPPKMCPYGKKTITIRCSDQSQKSLLTYGQRCGKLLNCQRIVVTRRVMLIRVTLVMLRLMHLMVSFRAIPSVEKPLGEETMSAKKRAILVFVGTVNCCQIAAEANVLLKYHKGIGAQTLVGGTQFKVDQQRLETSMSDSLLAYTFSYADYYSNSWQSLLLTSKLPKEVCFILSVQFPEAYNYIAFAFQESMHDEWNEYSRKGQKESQKQTKPSTEWKRQSQIKVKSQPSEENTT
ncbi:retrovirus-related pol polyprotein from transposon TNT 1-94 [Tanacetum coccineum]